MVALVTETYQSLKAPIEELDATVVDPVENILRQINTLNEDLKTYKETIKMNTEFFM